MVISIFTDLTGRRFGRLTVKNRAKDYVSKSGRRRVMWLCCCDCGKEVTVMGDNLKGLKTKSCGCLSKEANHNNFATHGESNTKLYGIWCSMKTRCYNPNCVPYPDYGGRGIHMCDEWKNDYVSFRDWSYQNGYKEHLTIDRVDNNRGYSPDNCRWVASGAQANNRRSNRKVFYNGEEHTVTEWARILNKNTKTIFSRIYSGWDMVDAITK